MKPRSKPPLGKPPGHVRIIAGRWRGTRLNVADAAGLRPSPDRVRETMFNWLQHEIAGADCLDLYAGSGALGFEAASRGAARVVMVERDPAVVAGLRASAGRLRADTVEIHAADALRWLDGAAQAFDVVFVDPPFAAELHQPTLDKLRPWLKPGALVYVEHAREASPPVLEGSVVWREGKTRETGYRLLRCT